MAREIELPATLESASGDQLTISSPTSGRFFHAKGRTLAEGLVLAVGEVIGSIAPTVAGDDFSRLELAVDEALLEQQRIDQELKRVAPLVEKGLLPDKRLAALESDRAVATARLQAARRRLGQVTSPGGEGGLPVRVTKIGVLSKVLVDNGAPVEPGEPLVRLAGTGPLWAKARFVARPSVELAGGVPVALRLAGSERIDLGSEARFVSALPVVDERSQLASWTAELGLTVGEELKPGLASVLIVRLGAPKERLAVIESAVVEINTRAYVFVQTGGESFEKRRVVLGVRDGGFVEVLTGVDPGERAVTQGGFDIHLASVMGTVESHRH
jgi:multidrug efflux pump subunit AcrA (membrane-fusion protein)